MLTVVTHTNPDSGRDITRCVESVRAALLSGMRHVIINCYSEAELMVARWNALQLDEFICFVDDDDHIAPNALSECLTAITEANVGLAFTNEVLVDVSGVILGRNDSVRDYQFVKLSPNAIHHLCVIRTSAVHPQVKAIADHFGFGLEWLMKAYAACQHGAVHVPIDGYYWVQHAAAHHNTPSWQTAFSTRINQVTPYIAGWTKHHGPIQVNTAKEADQ